MNTMRGSFLTCVVIFITFYAENGSAGRPQFETNPQYSDSYMPAAMQVIAYLTEAMKYDLRPPSSQPATPTSTTAPRPTPPHNPGLFQPHAPPPHRLIKAIRPNRVSTVNKKTLGSIIRQYEVLPSGLHELDLDLLGEGAKELHRAINGDMGDNSFEDFLGNFDDDARNTDLLSLLRQKTMPPTRAYVSLLTLYDLMNKESKRLNLNSYNGFSDRMMQDLNTISSRTSAFQLQYLLNKLLELKETADPMLENKIKSLLADLQKDDSYINIALMYIPPLPFAL